MRAVSVPSALATSWVWTVVVPLPNSAVPTRSVYAPSASTQRCATASCPRGGMVAIMAMPTPCPTRQVGPVGASTPFPRASAASTRSRHWSSPYEPKRRSSPSTWVTTSGSSGRIMFSRRNVNGSIPSSPASSSIADSRAKIT